MAPEQQIDPTVEGKITPSQFPIVDIYEPPGDNDGDIFTGVSVAANSQTAWRFTMPPGREGLLHFTCLVGYTDAKAGPVADLTLKAFSVSGNVQAAGGSGGGPLSSEEQSASSRPAPLTTTMGAAIAVPFYGYPYTPIRNLPLNAGYRLIVLLSVGAAPPAGLQFWGYLHGSHWPRGALRDMADLARVLQQVRAVGL